MGAGLATLRLREDREAAGRSEEKTTGLTTFEAYYIIEKNTEVRQRKWKVSVPQGRSHDEKICGMT